MATRVYGVNRGGTAKNVTEGVGAAMVGKDVEVSFDLTKGLTKAELIQALEYIQQWIITNQKWPPA